MASKKSNKPRPPDNITLSFRAGREEQMAQILIRDLDDDIVKALKESAERSGRSLQAELKLILEEAARLRATEFWKLAADLRNRFQGRSLTDSVALLREHRGR